MACCRYSNSDLFASLLPFFISPSRRRPELGNGLPVGATYPGLLKSPKTPVLGSPFSEPLCAESFASPASFPFQHRAGTSTPTRTRHLDGSNIEVFAVQAGAPRHTVFTWHPGRSCCSFFPYWLPPDRTLTFCTLTTVVPLPQKRSVATSAKTSWPITWHQPPSKARSRQKKRIYHLHSRH